MWQHLPGDLQGLVLLAAEQGVPQGYLGPAGKWVGSVACEDSCPSLCQAAPVLPRFRPLGPEVCILKPRFSFLLVQAHNCPCPPAGFQGWGGVCWWFRKEEGFAGRRIYGVAWVRKRGTRGEEEEACLQKLSWAGWGLSVGSPCPLLLLTVCSRKCERNPAAQSRGPNWTLRTSAITGPSRADWHYCCCCCWVASVVSDSVQPHRLQPTRLPCPWDSPGKNTGVGCHFLLQCMKVKSESEVTQSCPTLATPWTAAHQAPLSLGFSRQEYRSGLPCPSPMHESEE